MAMPSTAKSLPVDKDVDVAGSPDMRKAPLKTHLDLDDHKMNLDDFEPKDEVKIFKVVTCAA
jgi:hypothetical protein